MLVVWDIDNRRLAARGRNARWAGSAAMRGAAHPGAVEQSTARTVCFA